MNSALFRTACLAAAWLSAIPAWSQNPASSWPARTVRVIVASAPGGITDIAARVVSARLSDALGVQVISENRPGAGGAIGVEFATRAAPNGYTLLATTSG